MLALVINPKLLIVDVQAGRRVKTSRILDLEVCTIQRLGPMEGWGDDWDRLRYLLKVRQKVILPVPNLVDGVARRTFSLYYTIKNSAVSIESYYMRYHDYSW